MIDFKTITKNSALNWASNPCEQLSLGLSVALLMPELQGWTVSLAQLDFMCICCVTMRGQCKTLQSVFLPVLFQHGHPRSRSEWTIMDCVLWTSAQNYCSCTLHRDVQLISVCVIKASKQFLLGEGNIYGNYSLKINKKIPLRSIISTVKLQINQLI